MPGESSTPVSVTCCAVFQVVALKVSDDGDTVPSAVSELATPSTTFPVGSLASFTENVAVPPPSVVPSGDDAEVDGDSANPAVSSSARVSAAPVTDTVCVLAAATLFAAVPATVAVRSAGLSMASSTAVIVAVSAAFAVCPAAITMVAPAPGATV